METLVYFLGSKRVRVKNFLVSWQLHPKEGFFVLSSIAPHRGKAIFVSIGHILYP
jgi:hypothetical protein